MKYAPIIVLALLAPLSAYASALSLTPAQVSVAAGQTFTIAVTVLPGDSAITSVSAHLAYDPELLEETWFTFASGWFALAEPGYDAVDNASGAMIKTAGYPGGITRPTQLGVATFKARRAGEAMISPSEGTQMLDGDGANRFAAGAGEAAVSIHAALVASAAGEAPPLAPGTTSPQSPRASTSTHDSFLASALAARVSVPVAPLLGAILCFVLGMLSAYAWARYRARKKSS